MIPPADTDIEVREHVHKKDMIAIVGVKAKALARHLAELGYTVTTLQGHTYEEMINNRLEDAVQQLERIVYEARRLEEIEEKDHPYTTSPIKRGAVCGLDSPEARCRSPDGNELLFSLKNKNTIKEKPCGNLISLGGAQPAANRQPQGFITK